MGRPGLFHGLLGLLGSPRLEQESLTSWLKDWTEAYRSLTSQKVPVKFQPFRMKYYLSAFQEFAESDQPALMLWPFVSTWTQLVGLHPEDSTQRSDWSRAMGILGSLDRSWRNGSKRLILYLDLVEETLESWARKTAPGMAEWMFHVKRFHQGASIRRPFFPLFIPSSVSRETKSG